MPQVDNSKKTRLLSFPSSGVTNHPISSEAPQGMQPGVTTTRMTSKLTVASLGPQRPWGTGLERVLVATPKGTFLPKLQHHSIFIEALEINTKVPPH